MKTEAFNVSAVKTESFRLVVVKTEAFNVSAVKTEIFSLVLVKLVS